MRDKGTHTEKASYDLLQWVGMVTKTGIENFAFNRHLRDSYLDKLVSSAMCSYKHIEEFLYSRK